ncbi:MAG TPA: LytS/YhcK type 5TM receptor domain-containing protein [Bacillales bacterium]
MWELFLSMLERLAIIVTIAYVMTRFRFFREGISSQSTFRSHRVRMMVMFGIFGIIGTYTGLTLNTETLTYTRWTLSLDNSEALVNSRVIGIVTAGLLGGFRIGIGAGIIAGFHRYLLGGFTAFPCGLSAVIAGIIAGWAHRVLNTKRVIAVPTALLVGSFAEMVQMGTILALSHPFEQALQLVEKIAVPMIVANGIGCALFILIVRNVISEEEKTGAIQAEKALHLAELTFKHLRKGLTETSATKTCELLYSRIQVSAIEMTKKVERLAFTGALMSNNETSGRVKEDAVPRVLQTGEPEIVFGGERHGQGSLLYPAMVVPLKSKDETIGTLIFYLHTKKEIKNEFVELIKSLASLLSYQLEIAEAERYEKLAKQAEIKVLQAQVNPHFLFNALNTISSLIRIDPGYARQLLISLSYFFRQNLQGMTDVNATLKEELDHVKAYLMIEEARFPDKLNVQYLIEEDLLFAVVPRMTLQPLVENTVKHGLKPLVKGSKLSISVRKEHDDIIVAVYDNGRGIPQYRLQGLLEDPVRSESGTGLGLYNVNRRLIITFGDQARLHIQSKMGQGTMVSFKIPAEGRAEYDTGD